MVELTANRREEEEEDRSKSLPKMSERMGTHSV